MERRKFLGLGLGALALVSMPRALFATNYREKLPAVWKVKNNEKAKEPDLTGTKESIKTIFGTDATTEGKVKLKAPDIAENGAVVPVSFKADGAKRIAVFQTANPEATVAIFDVPEVGIPEYSIRIKLQKTGIVTVVAEIDGKLYSASKLVKVTIGGCGG